MNDLTTNEKIAQLIAGQTYSERMEMARFFSDAAMELANSSGTSGIDNDYFASLFEAWADQECPEDDPTEA